MGCQSGLVGRLYVFVCVYVRMDVQGAQGRGVGGWFGLEALDAISSLSPQLVRYRQKRLLRR